MRFSWMALCFMFSWVLIYGQTQNPALTEAKAKSLIENSWQNSFLVALTGKVSFTSVSPFEESVSHYDQGVVKGTEFPWYQALQRQGLLQIASRDLSKGFSGLRNFERLTQQGIQSDAVITPTEAGRALTCKAEQLDERTRRAGRTMLCLPSGPGTVDKVVRIIPARSGAGKDVFVVLGTYTRKFTPAGLAYQTVTKNKQSVPEHGKFLSVIAYDPFKEEFSADGSQDEFVSLNDEFTGGWAKQIGRMPQR
jgi:hypothetical protein